MEVEDGLERLGVSTSKSTSGSGSWSTSTSMSTSMASGAKERRVRFPFPTKLDSLPASSSSKERFGERVLRGGDPGFRPGCIGFALGVYAGFGPAWVIEVFGSSGSKCLRGSCGSEVDNGKYDVRRGCGG